MGDLASRKTDAEIMACAVAAHAEADRLELERLRSLSMKQRGEMLIAACRAAAALYESRMAAGLPPEEPAPWPASTWEFLKKNAAKFRSSESD
jgi:hypothetical protein